MVTPEAAIQSVAIKRKTIRETLLDREEPIDIDPDSLQCILRDVL